MADKKKPRGAPISLPDWWREELDKRVHGFSSSKLAEVLNELVPNRGWDDSTVRRFLRNESPTHEMMLAFCAAFDLTVPVFIAFDRAEALALAKTQREHEVARRQSGLANPEKSARIDTLNNIREGLEKTVRSQTKALDSRDEGTKVRGRYRSVGRSRSPAS